jgi:hypothetical protein
VTTAYWWSAPALTERLAVHGLVVERSDSHPGVKRQEGHLVARLVLFRKDTSTRGVGCEEHRDHSTR